MGLAAVVVGYLAQAVVTTTAALVECLAAAEVCLAASVAQL